MTSLNDQPTISHPGVGLSVNQVREKEVAGDIMGDTTHTHTISNDQHTISHSRCWFEYQSGREQERSEDMMGEHTCMQSLAHSNDQPLPPTPGAGLSINQVREQEVAGEMMANTYAHGHSGSLSPPPLD